jgi:hypothetical protein
MMPSQNLPSENTDAGYFARMLLRALGPAFQAAQTTITGALFLSLGDALTDIRDTLNRCINQAFATTATDMLSELETEYGLEQRPDLSDADRQARLTAKVRATRGGTDQRILAAVQVFDPAASIVSVTCVEADAVGNIRKTNYFTLYAPTAWTDTTQRAAINQLIGQMKPAHTLGRGGDGSPFKVTNTTLGRLNRNGLG